MKQNPILTIAQNLVKRDTYERSSRRGVPRDFTKSTIETFTIGQIEKKELIGIMPWLDRLRDMALNGEHINIEAVYTTISEVIKSRKLKTMFDEIHRTDPEHPDAIFGLCIPFDLNTRYRKMSPRVYNYISSLGGVSGDLCRAAVEDLSKMIDPSTGIFHDMILVDTCKGPMILEAFLTSKDRIRLLMRFDSVSIVKTYYIDQIDDDKGDRGDLADIVTTIRHIRDLYNEDVMDLVEEKVGSYDPLSFYVNIYLAEKTNHLVPGKESNYDKKKVVEICRAENKAYDPKDKSVRYEYIDVSEERWKQHTEFKNAVHRKMEGDRKWYKSHWWRKAHYMKAGKDKHLAFVEATICHRSCGRIEEEDVQVVQVLR